MATVIYVIQKRKERKIERKMKNIKIAKGKEERKIDE
jgi:hypothetical protein